MIWPMAYAQYWRIAIWLLVAFCLARLISEARLKRYWWCLADIMALMMVVVMPLPSVAVP
jgi:hypothetical protein